MKVCFGPFVLDAGARELVNDGTRVHLSPKAFDLLEILVARRPNVVAKDDLLTAVWPGKEVEEANLAILIGELRRALGDDSRAPSLILTVARRGYRFAGNAPEPGGSGGGDSGDYLRWWLTWNETTLPLKTGENLVGRHPASAVWINGASVSRTHACLTVSGERVTVEDRGSRNGTFVGGRKLTGPHLLVDGDTVVFGSEAVTFRQWSDDLAAGTEPVRAQGSA